jgi:hypothetical protein
MKKWVSFVSLLFLMAISYHSFSQEIGTDAKSPHPPPSSRMEKKALQKKEARKELGEKAEEKERKHQYKIQTREVKKRMKKSKKEAERHNENKKDSFLKRLFSKKQR